MHFPKSTLLNAQAVSANTVTGKVSGESVVHHTFWAKIPSNGITGTISVEGTNAEAPDESFSSADWSTIAGSSQALPGTTSPISYDYGPTAFKWLRLKIAVSGGSDTVTARWTGRGWK